MAGLFLESTLVFTVILALSSDIPMVPIDVLDYYASTRITVYHTFWGFINITFCSYIATKACADRYSKTSQIVSFHLAIHEFHVNVFVTYLDV